MRILFICLLPGVLLAGCAHSEFSGPKTAESYYATLHGNHDRGIFDAGYDYASADAAGKFYAAERNAQKYDLPELRGEKTALHKKILTVRVGPYVDGNKIIHNGSYRYVELPEVQ